MVISPSSSDKYIPVMSPVALSNTSGFSNVKNAVPDVPSLDFVSFTSGTDVSTESRTKEIVAPFETSKDFLLLLKLLLCGLTTDCFACFRKEARVVVEARRPTREDKVDIFFYPREERLVVFLSVWDEKKLLSKLLLRRKKYQKKCQKCERF